MKAVFFALLIASIVRVQAIDTSNNTKLFFFREDCFNDMFTSRFKFVECTLFTVSIMLGYTLIFFSCFLKIPQIARISEFKSVEGISGLAIYAECFSLLTMVADSFRLQMPFSVYGGAISIIVQNLIILSQLWTYGNKPASFVKVIQLIALFIASYFVFTNSISDYLFGFINQVAFFLILLSRLP